MVGTPDGAHEGPPPHSAGAPQPPPAAPRATGTGMSPKRKKVPFNSGLEGHQPTNREEDGGTSQSEQSSVPSSDAEEEAIEEQEGDLDAEILSHGSSDTADAKEEWTFAQQLQEDHEKLKARGLPGGRGLALIWKDLSVRGVGGVTDIQFKIDIGTFLFPWRTWRFKRNMSREADKVIANEAQAQREMHWNKGDKGPGRGKPGLRRGQRYLLHDFTGCLKPGEMMLVVGRPGSGCSTFLKTLTGLTGAYAGVDGAVYYGALKSGSAAFRPYAADVVYSGEEDMHDANLLVGRTLDFALRMETPSKRARPLDGDKPMKPRTWVAKQKSTLLKALGIAHTASTKVGNQYVRGVSGGERRRVTLAEAMTTNAQILCFDNATRGLDASSALEFAKLGRTLSTVGNKCAIMSLYQAGNGIYEQFDKICVIAEGHLIFFGPRVEARLYFERMGFEHMGGANTADFLTAVTATNERKIRPGFEGRVPTAPSEFGELFRQSDIFKRMCEEADEMMADQEAREAETAAQKQAISAEKSILAVPFLANRTSWGEQIWACVIKEVQVRWGDQWSLWGRLFTTLVMGFVTGSVFYNLPLTTNGLYERGGVLFFTIIYPAILCFADVQSAYVARAVLSKHKAYSLYAAPVLIVAQNIVDFPIFFVQLVIYTIVIYFLAGLQVKVGLYFACLCWTYFVTACLTTLFRAIGFTFNNYNDASKISGSLFTIFVLYSGYVIYTPLMKRWFSWLRWVNPIYYSMESLISNEMDGLNFQCVSPALAPHGPSYLGGPQGCAVPGSTPGSTIVEGKHYMGTALWFHKKDTWRNLAIVAALWTSSAILAMLALSYIPAAGATKSVLLFKSGGGGQYLKSLAKNGDDPRDVEDGPSPQQTLDVPSGEGLRRWGTTHSEVSHREWPSRRLSIASDDGGAAYRERIRPGSDGRTRSRSPVAEKIRHPSPLLETISDSDEGDRAREAPAGDQSPQPGNVSSDTLRNRRHRPQNEKPHRSPRASEDTYVDQSGKARQSGTGTAEKQRTSPPTGGSDESPVFEHGTTFTWKDLDYTVKADGGEKPLLRKVSGYCKAGTITALMGSSGAGKTTLMDCLAARKDEGTLTGEVMLNGQRLPVSFQRTTGYCEQLDIHLPQATVREALEFSALLRQPRHVPNSEKLAYVDEIIDLLEMHDIEDAIIGEPGAGLGVEQRKRLTIGVELVSRPNLLFLDEPTSGLDGQSSFLIVGFMQKLAATGQSILCTIHQPSAALFAGFDMLLLLKAGGRTVYFGPVKDVPDYFIDKGVRWPKDVNPAEFMIDIVSGHLSKERDWSEVWLESQEHDQMLVDLEQVKRESAENAVEMEEDDNEFASTTLTQLYLVSVRSTVQLYRNIEYVGNKILLHIGTALIIGFSYWNLGNTYADLQNRMFAIFQFVFVAPSVIVQTQPKFIANRDIFEAREKKAKFYSWQVFCFGEIVAEVPYLLICAFLFWCCWYPTIGLSMDGNIACPVFLQMVCYEFLYTGMGQFIAAYAPNPVFAALVLPLFISVLAIFCGIVAPYPALNVFWRYWMYWIDPFTHLMKGLMTFPMWEVDVHCKDTELGFFDPPEGQTCGEYMATFMETAMGYVDNPDATSNCGYCMYRKGYEYLYGLNIKHYFVGWEGILITMLYCCSSYALVFLLLKLRSKATKTAS